MFQYSEAEYEYTQAENWADVVAQKEKFAAAGYRIFDLNTSLQEGERSFSLIFVKSSIETEVQKLEGWTAFVKAKRAMAEKGFLLYDIEAYPLTNDDFLFIGLWMKEDKMHKVWKLDSVEGLKAKTDEMALKRFYIRDVDHIATPNGTSVYLAIYHKALPTTPRAYVVEKVGEAAFKKDLLQREKSGFRVTDFCRYKNGDDWSYLCVYQKGNYATKVLWGLEKFDFDGHWEQLEAEGLKLVDIE